MKTDFEVIPYREAIFARVEKKKNVTRFGPDEVGNIKHCYDIEKLLTILELGKKEGKNSIDFGYNTNSLIINMYNTKSKKEELEEQIAQKEIELEKLKKKLNDE